MNTENENAVRALPCPFCGGEVDPEGWLDGSGGRGPECEECGATAESLEAWNRRAALQVSNTDLLEKIVKVADEQPFCSIGHIVEHVVPEIRDALAAPKVPQQVSNTPQDGMHVVCDDSDGLVAYSNVVAGQLLCIRDLLEKKDVDGALFALLHLSDPYLSKADGHEWSRMEEIAKSTPPQQQKQRCPYCDNSGDVHRADGEWLGECTHCKQQEQKHGSAGSSPLDSSGEAVYAGCDMASGPDRTGEFVTSSTQALSMEASRELKVAVSDLRKAAYEFGQVESADNYNLMMEAQRRLFSVVLSDSTFTPTPSESQAGTTQEAVAWVEVKDAHEGPYDFHGKELLPRGKHNLYLAPPTSTAIAAMVIHKVTDKVGSWLRSAEIRLADVDTRTDEIKYQGIVDELRGLLTELRALTPANAEAELEALMIEATKHGMSYEEANHEAGTGNMHEAASAIVRRVLDEKGEGKA